jgi:hypothetical protein
LAEILKMTAIDSCRAVLSRACLLRAGALRLESGVIVAVVCVALGTLSAQSPCEAQTRSSFGSQRGATGARGGATRAGAGAGTFGAGRGTTNRGAGGMGTAVAPTVSPLGAGIQTGARADGFVGRDGNDMTQSFRGMSDRQRRGMMFDMIVENLNEMRNSRRRGSRRPPPPPARVSIQPDFGVVRPDIVTSVNTAVTLANRSLERKGIAVPEMMWDDGTLVIRGNVATDYDRSLVEQLLLLEPGISQVRNELQVAPRTQ